MKIRKAVITAGGKTQRLLPLQRFVDRDGAEKTALQIILEEVLSAGVEEICLVICPGDESPYRQAAGDHAQRLSFVEQHNPRGYGDALLRAAGFTGSDPFVHLVSDHLYVATGLKRCAQQLVELASAQNCAVSAVQPTRESMLPFYGTIGGRRVPKSDKLYEIEQVIEKPTPTTAEQSLIVPGLRAGHYLCLFGMHVLTPGIMTILKTHAEQTPPGENIQLSLALAKLAQTERYLAYEMLGSRYNIGLKYGLMYAQFALALAGNDRENVLAQLVELLAAKKMNGEEGRG